MTSSQFKLDRREFCGGAALVGITSLALTSRAQAAAQDALSLMQSSYQTNCFANARFAATLSLNNASGSRQQRSLAGIAKLVGQDAQARLIRFSSPADMAGVATLTIERGARADELWIYLPAMRRVRRLVTANRADPWVGSDFSFGDILGHKVSDWNHAISGSERLTDGDAWQIDSKPVSMTVARETGYGWRRSWIRKTDFALLRCDFFAGNGQILKSAIFSDLRVFDARRGKIQPMTMAVRNIRQSSTSMLKFAQFTVDQIVADRELSPEALAR